MRNMDGKAQYTLAALADMAARYDPQDPRRPVRLEDIVRRTGAPGKYLSTLLPRLKRRGLVGSAQGPRGGYWLMRPPGSMSVAEVLGALNSPKTRREGRFVISAPYRGALDRLDGELDSARGALLRDTTLADFARGL